MDYTKICFVVMPFGEKPVSDHKVNFDRIYDTVFDPAIRATALPEGGNLIPRRTDRDFFSGEISNEMFQYIEYSRFVLADISGLNANVFYEPIPLTLETKCKMWQAEGKHQNTLLGVPIEQRVFYTCAETRRKSAPADSAGQRS